jgi:hypothetical protein
MHFVIKIVNILIKKLEIKHLKKHNNYFYQGLDRG